jgi:hypothetical protein
MSRFVTSRHALRLEPQVVNAVYRLFMVRPIRGAKDNMTTQIKAMAWSISGSSMASLSGAPARLLSSGFL